MAVDCKEFREKHVAFVDDVLSAADMGAMHRHLRECLRCARQDTNVRRGLLLARNIPQIEPSADFMERLQRRLSEVEPLADVPPTFTFARLLPSPTIFAVLAASVLAVAGLAVATLSTSDAEPILLPPVVASLPAEPPDAVASPAVVASLATGIPVWPAVFMVSQPEVHMVNVELRDGQ